MELCLKLIEQIVCLFLMSLGGYIITRAGLLRANDGKVLSTISVYLLVPCMLFSSFLIEWTPEKIGGILIAFVAAVLVHAAYLLLTKVLRRWIPMSDVDAASLVFTNAGNVIIPLVSGTLGPEYIFYSSAYMVVQNCIMWTYGVKVIGRQTGPQLKRILKNPTMIAIAVGLLFMLFPLELPAALVSTVSSLGGCMAPVAMILVGILMAQTDLKRLRAMTGMLRITALRLLAYPLVTVALLAVMSRFVHHPDAWQILFVVLLAGAGPSAALVTQVAQLYDNEAERASAINVLTTLACMATLPMVTALAQICLI